VSVSNGVTLDTTAPEPENIIHDTGTNFVQNPSFESASGSQTLWEDLNKTDICLLDITYLPLSWGR